ncbi:membrane protein [Pseudomonas sp. 1-7]|nr:membrane protein [Pseudomonas sp. 1-7]
MLWRMAADALVLVHLSFILFVLLGGLLLLRWPRLIWLHLPAVAWGIVVECLHLGCPLTPWENQLRRMAGQAGYDGGFIEHYLIPLIYPAGLTPQIQSGLGAIVVLLNLAVYTWLIWRWRNKA